MAHSRPFGLFILVLCLVVCVCARCDVSNAEAMQAVNGARESAKKVLKNLEDEFIETLMTRTDINTYKRNAEKAATEAEEAAKGNSEAEAIAEKAKKASDEVLKLYANASKLIKNYLDPLKKLRTKAQELDGKAKKDPFVNPVPDTNYTKIKEDADAIKIQAEALNREYNKESSSFPGVFDTEKEMLKFLSAAQLARYHVDAIVSIAKVDTLIKSVESDIKLAEQKRDEINGTVQEMKNLFDNSPKDLIPFILTLYSRTEAGFESASRAVEEAKKAKARILEQKAEANDALVKVETETDVKKARDEAGVVDQIAEKAEEDVEEIKKALDSATMSATTAVNLKKSALNELNKQTNKPDATQKNDKTNPQDSSNTHQPVKDTTESPAESGTKQPTTTNPDQSMTEQPVQDTTQSPVVIGTKQPTTTNPDQPGSGGTEPTQPSSNDGAMTVSVPMLLALIVCAALH